MLTMRAEVDARDMARVMRVLRSVDKDLASELGKRIKSELNPIAKLVASSVNSNPAPMSGMANWKKKPWGKLSGVVRVTPGYSFKSPNLVTIDFERSSSAFPGVAIAENAGSKTVGNSLRGQLFIRRLQTVVPGWNNGGRYLYRAFLPYKPVIYKSTQVIIDQWTEKVNLKLGSN